MSREDVETIRAAFEQFSRGDFAVYAQLPGDLELVIAPEMPDAGTYRGEAARRWLDAWTQSFEQLTLEPVEFRDLGDKVMTEYIQRGFPKGGATPLELRSWSVSTMRDGAVVRLELYLSQAEALEAAGIHH
jgi:ketosteroid isomerase-like protein